MDDQPTKQRDWIGYLIQSSAVVVPVLGVFFWFSTQLTSQSVLLAEAQRDVASLRQDLTKSEDARHDFESHIRDKLDGVSSTTAVMANDLSLLRKALKQ